MSDEPISTTATAQVGAPGKKTNMKGVEGRLVAGQVGSVRPRISRLGTALHKNSAVGTGQQSGSANEASRAAPLASMPTDGAAAEHNTEVPTTPSAAPGATAQNAAADEPLAEDVIIEFGEMPPGTILTKAALARIFNREEVSIDRAVKRGELPYPAKLLGYERWTTGAIVRHHERRMAEAEQDAAEIAKHRA